MTASLPTVEDLDVAGKRVLVRCDLNVPIKDGVIGDDLRIRASLSTLRDLLGMGARLAVCSHLGRPKGTVVPGLSLAPVATRLAELLDVPAAFPGEIIGDEIRSACASDAPLVVVENLRFEPGEEANDPSLAEALASLADAYVNDAFGSSHRAHASVVGVPERLPSAAGRLLVAEVDALEKVLVAPEKPFLAVLGGAKVSDKLGVIGNLLERVDAILIGGAMAFTLLVARGEEVGRSLVERERVDEVRDVLRRADESGTEVLLPTDVVAADSPEAGADHAVVPLAEIGERMGVDIGPATARVFVERVRAAKTVVWNGPMGIFEVDDYARGTEAVAEAVAEATRQGAYTVVGGGDSAAALAKLGMADAVSHLSTGGGASLEMLEGIELPGVAVLRRKGGA